jgi:hypothetical protein
MATDVTNIDGNNEVTTDLGFLDSPIQGGLVDETTGNEVKMEFKGSISYCSLSSHAEALASVKKALSDGTLAPSQDAIKEAYASLNQFANGKFLGLGVGGVGEDGAKSCYPTILFYNIDTREIQSIRATSYQMKRNALALAQATYEQYDGDGVLFTLTKLHGGSLNTKEAYRNPKTGVVKDMNYAGYSLYIKPDDMNLDLASIRDEFQEVVAKAIEEEDIEENYKLPISLSPNAPTKGTDAFLNPKSIEAYRKMIKKSAAWQRAVNQSVVYNSLNSMLDDEPDEADVTADVEVEEM